TGIAVSKPSCLAFRAIVQSRIRQLSPPLRGGEAATSIKYREASFADPTASSVNNRRNCWNLITTPSARLTMHRNYFLIAQPPLLGEEGKIRYFTSSATVDSLTRVRQHAAMKKRGKLRKRPVLEWPLDMIDNKGFAFGVGPWNYNKIVDGRPHCKSS